jgi:hypothetical protein
MQTLFGSRTSMPAGVAGSTWVIDHGRRHARSCHGPFCHTNWQTALAAQWPAQSRRAFRSGRTPLCSHDLAVHRPTSIATRKTQRPTRPPQNSVDDKHKPNQCEDHGYNGRGVRLRLKPTVRGPLPLLPRPPPKSQSTLSCLSCVSWFHTRYPIPDTRYPTPTVATDHGNAITKT